MAQRKGQICILFKEVPEGTHYRKGAYSWVPVGEGRQYIDKGSGTEYDPNTPASDIPEDFPGDTYFKEAGIRSMDEVRELHDAGDLQSVNGVGDKTEAEIKEWFNAD